MKHQPPPRKKRAALPAGVFEKHGAYYRVLAEGTKRKWIRLCAISEGLPAMYLALSKLAAASSADDDLMPKLVDNWMIEIGSRHKAKTQANDRTHNAMIARVFQEYRARDIRPSDVINFLKPYLSRPRSYNAYRTALRERLRYAESKDFRSPGTNPVDSVPTMSTKARQRYITDSELRRIKAAAMRGDDGLRTRAGFTLCGLIDMAYLTGQRIGDLLRLEWSAMQPDGILFEPSKTEQSTGVRILIQWTPRLRALVDRLKNPPPIPGKKEKAKPVSTRFVFTRLDGQPYTYDGASTAWTRARTRAGVTNAHFHDLRAKALTDLDERGGIGEAQRMGGHSTQSQTADYVRQKKARRVSATR
ncbi:tyrosine-type recombinase/integrase [Ottowia thiooxydans]|uniref:tyrosine-type recombinase/integrase n=1 Tax=Ottowia thiooxydans TaxID=219182 RepID=UPI0003F8B529|nr:tyrosine-type recombinase/integrase [Ottowia thiooxydans]